MQSKSLPRNYFDHTLQRHKNVVYYLSDAIDVTDPTDANDANDAPMTLIIETQCP